MVFVCFFCCCHVYFAINSVYFTHLNIAINSELGPEKKGRKKKRGKKEDRMKERCQIFFNHYFIKCTLHFIHNLICTSHRIRKKEMKQMKARRKEQRKVNVLFNDALNTF